MKTTAVLSIYEMKKMFMPSYNIKQYDNLQHITLKKSMRALKKLKPMLENITPVISPEYENDELFANKKIVFNKYTCEYLLPILEKIFRQSTEKFGLELPVKEIYIMAPAMEACAMISVLNGMSRIFTIVSEEKPLISYYDELYFKHGTVIRHLPEFNNNITQEAVIIRANGVPFPSWTKTPAIDLTDEPTCRKYVVKVQDVSVCDDKITAFRKLWRGESGLLSYSLTDTVPGVNAQVNINKKADKIFLLDTKRF